MKLLAGILLICSATIPFTIQANALQEEEH